MGEIENNIVDFLKPYIAEVKKSGVNRYEGVLYHSMLYILVDGSVLYVMDLQTFVDPDVVFAFNDISIDNYNGGTPNNMSPYYKFSEIQSIISHTNNMVYHDPVLHEDPKFMELATAKASDGAGFYFINTSISTIFTTVFPGLPSLQKTDTVGIKVYNIGDNKLLINYTVFKKKLRVTYDIFYKIINVNCPLR